MFAITRGRLAVAALGLSAAVASAQDSPTLVYGPVVGCPWGHCAAANHGTFGPALCAAKPACVGRSSYPLSDWHYIRQFCGPTLQPGTCYGHHQTKWRRWDEACAGVGGCTTAPEPAPLAPTTTPPQWIAPITRAPEPFPQPKAEPGKIATTETPVPVPPVPK